MGIGKKVSWAALGVGLGVTLVIGGSALAAGGSPSGTATPTTPANRPANGGPGLLIGAVHADGTWTVADGSTKDLSADLGRITAVGGGSISLHPADGPGLTVPAPGATRRPPPGPEGTPG